jgi:GH25 family lysozyme M1 (1,4-beta-N-acetylmuramidase)
VIFGWDMSHYDAPSVGTAAAEGFSFITHKAGGDQDDPEIGAWWASVKGQRDRLLVGAYWVLYPGRPAARADAFVARLDDQCPGWRDGPFLLQVDCEKWNNNPATAPGLVDITAFCDRLVARMPKLRPVVYAPKWVYGDSLAGLKYPLWASSYVTGSGPASTLYPGDSSSRWGAYSGQVPAILQFTSSATIAGQTTCDANAFRGTLAELTALVAPGWSDDMPLTDADATLVANKVLNGIKLAGTQTAASTYQRTLADETGDVWSAFMRGTTLGGDPLPPAGVAGQILAAIEALPAAVAQAVAAAVNTPDPAVMAKAIEAAVAQAVAAISAAISARPAS